MNKLNIREKRDRGIQNDFWDFASVTKWMVVPFAGWRTLKEVHTIMTAE